MYYHVSVLDKCEKHFNLFLNSYVLELTDDHNSVTTDVGNKVINNYSVPVRIEKVCTPTGGKKVIRLK